ncbi:PPE family protein [Mycolicibacter arupensis]|jgi:PPE-repeat protein|uniref:PPE family protein n=1 Tax=Mycolicibacter arupensis TaxID=342002 RepID=A0A5C7XEW7_9MYCO|nr:PPE family protein [Mycolicibacter arupensis]TXI48571.1 MAG: PPE family protein [Mycolicibacter arupensis]
MTAPVWLASPPEVHSALLSAGPGVGPLLESASAYSAISSEYAAVAAELDAVLAGVRAASWQGPSAQQYAAAHLPYLSWLIESSAQSASAASLHQSAAAAYTAALAGMPTLAELGTNHAVHATLVATNFFGINTIPIAVNEADYARMWIQAAEMMSVYHGVATAALASVPAAAPAPPILNPGAAEAAAPSLEQQIADLLKQYNMGFADPIARWLWSQLGVDGYPIEAFPFASSVTQMLLQIPGMTPILAGALGWSTFHTLMLVWPMGQIAVQLAIPIMLAAAPALAAAAGLGALGAIGAVGTGQVADPPLPIPMGSVSPSLPPTVPVPTGAEACACADPISSAGATTPSTVSAGLPAGGGAAGGGPGVGFGPTSCLYLVSSASASARRSSGARRSRSAEEDASESQGAPGEATTQALAAKRRQRRRAKQRGFGDEYMDMDIDVRPDWGTPSDRAGASQSGAGPLGFAGTAADTHRRAAGIAVLTGDGLDAEPRMPMLPGSWGDETG